MRRLTLMAFLIAAMVAAVGVQAGSASAQSATPVAHPGGPYHGFVGVPVQMSGTASLGYDLRFTWSFGDGTGSVGPVVSKVYTAPGVYTVTLSVIDVNGGVASASTTATISLGSVLCPVGVGGVCGVPAAGVSVPTGCVLTSSGLVCGTGVVTSGCYLSIFGTVVCGGVAGTTGLAGCVISSGGLICPGAWFGYTGTVAGALSCPYAYYSGYTVPWCFIPYR